MNQRQWPVKQLNWVKTVNEPNKDYVCFAVFKVWCAKISVVCGVMANMILCILMSAQCCTANIKCHHDYSLL